ncbi:hypothetical protein [Methylocucumis oryzae]|uniref:Uncharacterized protein n=1 Tax=Methylocucumis oryzae TaxID=1632867 RepID=A0A0F3IE91_9GAMM|nr:hypothetical protein [Methylocucumis oryzae]KJV05056.1 hypothetical protein VZ94_20945 [Methylocucumis oryzae]
MTSDDQDILPAIMHGMFMGAAIRIHVANKYLTFYSGGKLGEGVVDRYFCLQEFRYLRSTDACKYDYDMRLSVDVLRKWINKQHVFFRWELDIIRAINLTQWVAYPGHALCYRDFPIRSINLKK